MVATIKVFTDVYVVNRAMAGCGVNETINSFTDTSPLAKSGTYNYYSNKIKCLSINDWNFAIGKRELTLTADAPDDVKFAYEYQLPTDMISGGLKGLVDSADIFNNDYAFSDTTNYIWSNVANASAYYVRDVDEDKMPSWFVEYMASELALIMIPSLRLEVSDAKVVTVWNEKAKMLAAMADANETPAPHLQTYSSLIEARNS